MEKIRLENLCTIKTGKLDANAAVENGKYPFFTCAKEPSRIDTYAYDCECILLAGNGEFNVNMYNGKFNAYQRTYIIELIDSTKYSLKFIYYIIKNNIEIFKRISNGGIIKFIKLSNIQDILVPNISLDQQWRMVEDLDEISENIDNNKHQCYLFNELIKSRFIEMFGNEDNPKNWSIVNVEDVADIKVGVVIKPSVYYTNEVNGIKTFRSLNVGPGFIKDSDWVYFSKEGNEKNSKSILKENDLLIVRSGFPGTACVVTKKYEGCNAIDVIIARPNCYLVNPYYLCEYTNMPHGKKQIEEGIGGAAQQHFNVGKYSKLHLMLPPISLQDEFASFVEQIDKLKFNLQNQLKSLQELFDSKMDEYFND